VPVETPQDVRRALLAHLIDHAPTFPPARLSTARALAEDRRARASEQSWLLGRLVWPASRFDEVRDYDVPLSLVLDGPVPGPDPGTCRIEAVESRWPAVPDFAGDVFVELPIDAELERNLERVRAAGAFAKVRCGGERMPTNAELARFVRACAEARVPFKASAGLHRAVRDDDAHGFLNLLAAVLDPLAAEAALSDPDPARGLAPGLVSFGQARELRERFRGFGSCSFAEPVADLRALGLL
jgi:hypothetical protein